jgi:outer membrane protein assembly factor BamB
MRSVLFLAGLTLGADWPQFRGVNATGVAEEENLPTRFGPEENVVFRTELPSGPSSPSIGADRIFLTASENEELVTFALDRETGRVLWSRGVPRPRSQELHENNHPDDSGYLEERDWDQFRLRRQGMNALWAYRLGGEGDMTERNFLWKSSRTLPNVPSPLYYQGVLYTLKEGGILTSFDPETGEIRKQGRLSGAPGAYFSSPVASDGKIYAVSEEGKVAVVRAGAVWELLAVNALDDGTKATPAIADGTMYLRTYSALYAFRAPQ